MKQVSCRALGILLKAARRRGVEAVLLRGVPYDLAHLRTTRNHIEWPVFCRILRNAGEVWGLAELSDLNKAFMESAYFAYVGLIARQLFDARDLFDWICKQQVGGGAQLFGDCVRPSFEHEGADVTVIRLEIQPAYEPSPEFFWMTRGAFIAMPRMVDAGDATVEMTIDGRLATYRARYRLRPRPAALAVRMFTLPFRPRSAAIELKRTNEELQTRFQELAVVTERARTQADQLRIAHRVNAAVQRDLALGPRLQAIVRAMVDDAGFAWAALELPPAGDEPPLTASHGPADHAAPFTHRLEARDREHVGTLHVAGPEGGRLPAHDELLALITPTLAIGIQNARYREGLERLVTERTAELTSARDQLAASVVELREAQGARERFFANISHEIRTPLSIVLLAVADIEMRAGAGLELRARQGLTSIAEAARKLLRLVDELLLLAAGHEGKLGLHPEATDVHALLEALIAAWLPAAEAAGQHLTCEAAALVLDVDPVAFERIATNLVSNAIKYTPAGGAIEVELALHDDGVLLAVRDTGPGIGEDLAGRLFGRFERADDMRGRIAGTGIGLALVKQLVEDHGGTVTARPRPGGGTAFEVVLPRARLREAAATGSARALALTVAPSLAPTVLAEAPTVAPPSGGTQGTVLVVDDDPQLAAMIGALLAPAFHVLIAHDGDAALELARTHRPELLITDIDMPRMDGIELSRRFREVTENRLAPIIILSAVLDLRTRVAGLTAGATDYVTKPFEPAELLARVAAQFRMRDLAMRLHRAEQLSTLGVLTSGLSHELRNPANGVVNAIGPLLALLPPELTDPTAPTGELLGVIKECAEQIGVLAKQLLGFRSGRGELQLRVVPAREVVDRAVSLCRGALTGVEVRIDLPVDLAIACAPPLFLQVLTNLIENAAHAVGAGGWIELRAWSVGGRTSFEVRDSGKGVPVELHDKIFEPFFTTKPQGVGTGLGLPVSREIVHRHGGTLELRRQGDSSLFVVELPATPPAHR